MSSEQTNRSNSINMVQCPLHHFGCRDLIPQDQLPNHRYTQKHFTSVTKFMASEENKYDEAVTNRAMSPTGTIEPSSMEAITINDYERLMVGVMDIVSEIYPETRLMTAATSGSSNFDQIYIGSESISRDRITHEDRNPSHVDNTELGQTEARSDRSIFDGLLNPINMLSMDDSENPSVEQNPDSSPINAQQNITQLYKLSSAMVPTEFKSNSISTDSYFIWPINGLFDKIDTAATTYIAKPPINSSMFQAALDGHEFWMQLYLNGSDDPKYISIHIRLHFPIKNGYLVTGSFCGTIKVALVDQSSHETLVHHIKEYSGEMTSEKPCIHFDDFIDKNLVHQEGSQYVLNDSIRLIVYIPQTFQQKFVNVSANVRDALMQLTQSS